MSSLSSVRPPLTFTAALAARRGGARLARERDRARRRRARLFLRLQLQVLDSLLAELPRDGPAGDEGRHRRES